MSIEITWTDYAKFSYYEELNFIDIKWTVTEVEKFIMLVEDFIKRLSTGVVVGKTYPKNNMYSVVISKQTTVFYRAYPKQNTIALLLFWNNQKDPKSLKRLFKKVLKR